MKNKIIGLIIFITVISVLIGIYIMFSTDEKGMFKRIIESMKKWV